MAKGCKRCHKIRQLTIIGSLMAIFLLLLISRAEAEVYQYVNDKGRKVFVGSPSQIPHQYRNQSKMLKPSAQVSNTSAFSTSNQSAADNFSNRRDVRRLEIQLRLLETRVVVRGNQVLVPVTVTYHGRDVEVKMLLDTGASGTVFYRNALAKLEADSESAGYAQVAGGGVVKISSVEFDRIKVGPFKARHIRAFVMNNKSPNSGFDGLLGMDFLMNVEYKIDFARQVIIWHPKKHQALEKALAQAKAAPPSPAK